MAFECYVHDLSYLQSGSLSDLTLNFGEKSWQVHKALAICHSKWFQKALTSGLKETMSGVVTLEDDLQYANAVDCMVSYFYQAGYDASKYNAPEPLLHAQVAILADKYDCASLYSLAKTSFSETIEAVKSDDWAVIAAFIYDYTTMEAPAHVEIRNLVALAVSGRRSVLKTTLMNESVIDLLRSNADLATDLLLGWRHGLTAKGIIDYHFICEHCHYSHVGPRNCPNILPVDGSGTRDGPQCGKGNGNQARHTRWVNISMRPAFSCSLCDGCHTLKPDERGELPPPADVNVTTGS
ncbi:BTB/POZ domain-containing protein [Paraphaeosphaeria sporulosa]